MTGLGFPGDAIGLYREQIAAAQAMGDDPMSSQFINVEALLQQTRQGIQQALANSKPEALGSAVASLVRPGPEKPPSGEAVDLYLTLDDLGFEKDRVSGGLVEVFRKMATSGGTPTEVASGLASLRERNPDDFAVNIAVALLAFAEGKPAAIEGETGRLLALVAKSPLEPWPANPGRPGLVPRANSRQRAEAARRLGLWLVAQECWTRPGLKPLGDRFAATALEAARRHVDPRWPQAMLHEWGQVELDLGYRDQADRRWWELLEMVLARPDSRKPNVKGQIPERQATTREEFDKAILLARMAADRGLTPLSIRAIREAFLGGSPVGRPAWHRRREPEHRRPASRVQRESRDQPTGEDRPDQPQLRRRDRRGADGPDPDACRRTGKALVAPGRSRSRDLRDPLATSFSRPLGPARWTSTRLAWASPPPAILGVSATFWRRGPSRLVRSMSFVRPSGNAEGAPVAQLSGLVLQVQLELASGRPGSASDLLKEIEARLANDSLKASAELAALAALPALEFLESEASAGLVLARVVKNLSTQTGLEPMTTILQALAGHELDRGRLEAGRSRFREYLDFWEKTIVQNQPNLEVQSFYRRGLLLRVAAAFARRGLMPDALEQMGRYADLAPTRYQESSPNGAITALARGLADLPAVERYRLWKEWTLPKADRKNLRSLVAFCSDSNIPPADFKVTNVIPPGGIVATPSLLIEAAREAGKLDELASEVRALDPKTVEEARSLLALIEIARGKPEEAAAIVEAMVGEHEKAIEATNKTSAQQQQNATLPNAPLVTALVASACLVDTRLVAVGERLADALIRRPWHGLANGATSPTLMVVHLRDDLLRSKAARASGRDGPIPLGPRLDSWAPLEMATVNPFQRAVRPSWFEHDEHVGLQGPNPAAPTELAFTYPLAGTFEFSVDSLPLLPEGEAAIAFGGQPFAARSVGSSLNGFSFNNIQGSVVTTLGARRLSATRGSTGSRSGSSLGRSAPWSTAWWLPRTPTRTPPTPGSPWRAGAELAGAISS